MEMENNYPQTARRSKFAEFFGQFADPNFYIDLAKVAIREVIKAAALALTGTITFYIQKKFSGGAQIPQSTPSPDTTSLTQKAFGNDSYNSSSHYNRTSYYPTTQQPSATFPGFGAR
jgi:hypothetical protein